VVTLDDDEARQLGAILGGAYERPKIVEELEMALGELLIEWTPVPDTSPWIGKTLAEAGFRANLGITVIAILREPEPVTGALPDDVIQKGDTLVTVGKAGSYPAFQRVLAEAKRSRRFRPAPQGSRARREIAGVGSERFMRAAPRSLPRGIFKSSLTTPRGRAERLAGPVNGPDLPARPIPIDGALMQ
jgi:hypothetical protein